MRAAQISTPIQDAIAQRAHAGDLAAASAERLAPGCAAETLLKGLFFCQRREARTRGQLGPCRCSRVCFTLLRAAAGRFVRSAPCELHRCKGERLQRNGAPARSASSMLASSRRNAATGGIRDQRHRMQLSAVPLCSFRSIRSRFLRSGAGAFADQFGSHVYTLSFDSDSSLLALEPR